MSDLFAVSNWHLRQHICVSHEFETYETKGVESDDVESDEVESDDVENDGFESEVMGRGRESLRGKKNKTFLTLGHVKEEGSLFFIQEGPAMQTPGNECKHRATIASNWNIRCLFELFLVGGLYLDSAAKLLFIQVAGLRFST